MTISTLTLSGLLLSGAIYVVIAWRIKRNVTQLSHQLPLTASGTMVQVRNSNEFAAATTATTISLATLILAYADLAGYFGAWLLWTVFTTAVGIYLVRLAAPRIWRHLAKRGDERPTLHGFLGGAFESTFLSKTAALCTSLGFIGALAVELSVGSRFLASLAPIVPQWLGVLLISALGVGYTTMGGFRVVVVTDRIQMWAIWSAIVALGLLIAWQLHGLGGVQYVFDKMPRAVYDFSWRDGLASFLIGIALINIPTYIADMSIWQRIAASRDEATVRTGLSSSVVSATLSWTAFVFIACLLLVLVIPKEGENPLLTYLFVTGNNAGLLVGLLFVIVIVGLYGASLSTASTQLIAAGHTLHIDLLRAGARSYGDSRSELMLSRWLLLLSAVVAVALVEGLRLAGFTIADLVFSVYGAQLALVPPVMVALFAGETLRLRVSRFASAAVAFGFLGGWGSALLGKWLDNGDLVFLAPAVSLALSLLVLGAGVVSRARNPSA